MSVFFFGYSVALFYLFFHDPSVPVLVSVYICLSCLCPFADDHSVAERIPDATNSNVNKRTNNNNNTLLTDYSYTLWLYHVSRFY